MKSILLSLCLLVILASGCASHGPINSFAGPLPEKSAVAAIADDAAFILAGLYPPGHTAIRLLPASDAENDFAVAFENSLRARGFTLAAPDSSALALSYTLDVLEEKTAWYLQLRLSDLNGGGNVIARCYLASGLPEAGQSQALFEARPPMADFREAVRFEP
jgi:hypothetical protein